MSLENLSNNIQTNIHIFIFAQQNYQVAIIFAESFTSITEAKTRITVFNTEDYVFDNIIISDAIRATMSLPIVYIPH